jgi:hypothetical protein
VEESFINMLAGGAIDVEKSPLPAFDDGYEPQEQDEVDEVEEVEEEAFDDVVADGVKVGASKRS